MHEFSFAYNIFSVAINTAQKYNAKKIKSIKLNIGDFTLIVPEILRYSFEIVSKDSIAEGATLDITKTPGMLECEECSTISELWLHDPENKGEFTDDQGNTYTNLAELGLTIFKCKKCGSSKTALIGGKDTTIVSVELED